MKFKPFLRTRLLLSTAVLISSTIFTFPSFAEGDMEEVVVIGERDQGGGPSLTDSARNSFNIFDYNNLHGNHNTFELPAEKDKDPEKKDCSATAEAATEECVRVYDGWFEGTCMAGAAMLGARGGFLGVLAGAAVGWVPCREAADNAVEACKEFGKNLKKECNK